jgi:hypothetical protein
MWYLRMRLARSALRRERRVTTRRLPRFAGRSASERYDGLAHQTAQIVFMLLLRRRPVLPSFLSSAGPVTARQGRGKARRPRLFSVLFGSLAEVAVVVLVERGRER